MISLISSDGRATAAINPVGAALSELWFDKVQIVGSPDVYSGVSLYPWPNRIKQGTWTHDSKMHRLTVNDYSQQSALHGLVFSERFDWSQESPSKCVLTFNLEPSAGFPFLSSLQVSYELIANQLQIQQVVTNLGRETMPFAIGIHPYFLADENSRVEVAERKFELDSLEIDETFGPTLSSATLETADYCLEVEAESTKYFHIFTNRYDEPGKLWFAIEPQTSPADSLNTKVGVTQLEPKTSKHFNYRFIW